MNPQTIKSQIKKLAKDFNLKYNPDWFKFAWISKEQEILTEFLSDCEDPIYQKYGKNLDDRIKNLNKFIFSEDFQKCRKRFGGQAYSKRGLESNKKTLTKISNLFAKNEIQKLIKLTERKLENLDYIALLTKTDIEFEKERIFKYVLRHEWIHLLLFKNNIMFGNQNKRYWRYNEGLNECLASFADKKLKNLESERDRTSYSYEKQYFIYAIKFRELLKDKDTSKARKEAITKLMHKLR